MSQPRTYIQNILSVVSECATRSVGISTDGLKDEIYEARRLAGLKNFNAHKQYYCGPPRGVGELFQAPQLLHWPRSRVGLSAKQSYCQAPHDSST